MARKAFTSNFSKLFHRAFLMFILAVFIGSSAIALLPIFRVDAATASNFSMFTGVTPAQKKSVAEAWNKGGGDEYDQPGWSTMRIFVKDIAGMKAPPSGGALTFNEKLTKEMACDDLNSCESREPLFTTTYYCTVAGNTKTYAKPAGNAEYYEIVYAVGLKNNGNNGDDFVKRKDYNATGGPLLVKKFEMQDGGYLNDGTLTRDLTDKQKNPDHLDNKREGGKNGRDNNDWGIDDQDNGCRPGNGTTGSMKIKSFATLSSAEKDAFDPQKTSETITAGADTDGLEKAEACDEIGPLSWIVCPIVTASITAVDKMDGYINQLLTIDTKPIFDTTTQSGENYKKSWSIFRSIALGIVIIATLIIIISTAFGYEILDAYTLRKLLPRILISIVFITLSWNIMEFLITLTNDVGNGVRALIYLPFQGDSIEFGAITGLTSWLLLGIGGITLGAMGLLSLVATALLAVFIAFMVLVLRELIIIVLVLVAPIGIACLILPNTRKGWQIWQNTFTVMLVVFPIISAIIATGRVFAITVQNGDQGGDVVNRLIAFAAYLLPYFMLPFAFRMAGGAMATLAGLANDRSRGAFDRLKNYRGNKTQENFGKMKAGNRFHSGNPAAKAFNRTTSNIGMGVQGRFGMGERGRQGRAQLDEIAALDQVMKNPKWQGVHQNDDALRAMTYTSADEAKRELTKAGWNSDRINQSINAVQASTKFGRAQQIAAARQLVSTGTGYEDIEDMTETLARVSEGNISTAASLSGFANSETKKTGRHDLAPGFGDLNTAVQQAAGIDKTTGARVAAATPDYDSLKTKAWQSGSLYQHANDKPQNIKAAIKHHAKLLTSTDAGKREDAAVFFNELKAMRPNAIGAVQTVIDDATEIYQPSIDSIMNAPPSQNPSGRDRVVTTRDPQTGQAITRSESAKERIERRSRTYERPDPNNM